MLFEERPEFGEQVYNKGVLNPKKIMSDSIKVIIYLKTLQKTDDEIRKTITKMLSEILVGDMRKAIPKYCDMALLEANKKYDVRINTEPLYVPLSVLEEIKKINDSKMEKIAFVTYCVYKYYHCKVFDFQTTDDLIEACAKCKINPEVFRRLSRDKVMDLKVRSVRFRDSVVPMLHIELADYFFKLQDSNGITITNFVNLPMYYDRWAGNGKFYICQNCGAIQKVASRSNHTPKYCRICAKKVDNRRRVESRRNKAKK